MDYSIRPYEVEFMDNDELLAEFYDNDALMRLVNHYNEFDVLRHAEIVDELARRGIEVF